MPTAFGVDSLMLLCATQLSISKHVSGLEQHLVATIQKRDEDIFQNVPGKKVVNKRKGGGSTAQDGRKPKKDDKTSLLEQLASLYGSNLPGPGAL